MVVIGAGSGLLLGVYLTCLWGLRRSRGLRLDVVVVALALSPVAYFWGAEAFGWPTAGSIAASVGAFEAPVDRALFAGTIVVTALVVVAVLVRSGVPRRLERWSRRTD